MVVTFGTKTISTKSNFTKNKTIFQRFDFRPFGVVETNKIKIDQILKRKLNYYFRASWPHFKYHDPEFALLKRMVDKMQNGTLQVVADGCENGNGPAVLSAVEQLPHQHHISLRVPAR